MKPSSPQAPEHCSILTLAEFIAQAALHQGFCRVGFSDIETTPQSKRALVEWLAAGHAGDMAYMAEHGTAREARQVLQEAKTVVVVALAYARDPDVEATPAAASSSSPIGFVARYARGRDYHQVLKEKLYALAETIAQHLNRPILARPAVDTAPLLERDYAMQGGIGFIAKSTLAIVPGQGTYVLLGELLLDVALPPSRPAVPKCGSCSRCLDACPTQAFIGPHVLDARRCISYLTIEFRGSVPVELRPKMGNMVFGCDICQEVCPFNASPKPRPYAPEFAPRADLSTPRLIEWLHLGSAAYRKLVQGTALRRASRAQLARNAAIALGNSGDLSAVPELAKALQQHPSSLVRGHAAWALGRLRSPQALTALHHALTNESDATVQAEINSAITGT